MNQCRVKSEPAPCTSSSMPDRDHVRKMRTGFNDEIVKTVHAILSEDQKMSLICVKFVPKILSDEMKESWKIAAQEMLDEGENDTNFLLNLMTGDESWIYSYDPQTKMEPLQWKTRHVSSHPKNGHMERSHVKPMLIFFMISKGLFGRNFYQKVRLGSQNITKVCWQDCESHLEKNT